MSNWKKLSVLAALWRPFVISKKRVKIGFSAGNTRPKAQSVSLLYIYIYTLVVTCLFLEKLKQWKEIKITSFLFYVKLFNSRYALAHLVSIFVHLLLYQWPFILILTKLFLIASDYEYLEWVTTSFFLVLWA